MFIDKRIKESCIDFDRGTYLFVLFVVVVAVSSNLSKTYLKEIDENGSVYSTLLNYVDFQFVSPQTCQILKRKKMHSNEHRKTPSLRKL